MRLFIAIDIESGLKERISELQKKLQGFGKINFVEPDNLHYTLKFLGEVNDNEVGKVIEKINEARKNIDKFKVHIKGLGFFGSDKWIRVIWLGCEEGSQELKSITKAMKEKLSYIRKDEYSYKPHLTIGRVVSIENNNSLINLIAENKEIEIGEFVVNKISLKQSILTPKGPVYKDYKTFEVGNG